MENKRNFNVIKIISIIAVIIIIGLLLWEITPFMLKLSTNEGQIAFKDKINDMGFSRNTYVIWITSSTNNISILARRTFGSISRYVLWSVGRLYIYYNIYINNKYNYFFYCKEIREKIFI